MPILETQHDFGHVIETDLNWSESYYFNGYSPTSKVGLFARIAIRPNEPYIDGFISLWLPNGEVVRIVDASSGEIPDPGQPSLAAIQFERITPMERWRVRGVGQANDGCKLTVDVTFNALTPAFGIDASTRNYSGSAKTVVHSLASGHFEQAGRWQGEIIHGVSRYAFEGHGNRDKSWGPRRTDGAHGMRYWRWFSMNFGDDIHFGGIRIGTADGDMQRGWLCRAGQYDSVRGLDVKTSFAADGIHQQRLIVTARNKTNDTFSIQGQVLHSTPLIARGHEHMRIIEGLTQWTFENRMGYGICEYAHQLDADGTPVVIVENCG